MHCDTVRDMSGYMRFRSNTFSSSGGIFTHKNIGSNVSYPSVSGSADVSQVDFAPSRQVPTAAYIKPRAWGSLACVYLGA